MGGLSPTLRLSPLMKPISLSSKSAKSWDCAAMAIAMTNREHWRTTDQGLDTGTGRTWLSVRVLTRNPNEWQLRQSPRRKKAATMMTRAIGSRSTEKNQSPRFAFWPKSHWQINGAGRAMRGGGEPWAKSEDEYESKSRQETAIAIKFIYLFLCLAVGSFLICAQRST